MFTSMYMFRCLHECLMSISKLNLSPIISGSACWYSTQSSEPATLDFSDFYLHLRELLEMARDIYNSHMPSLLASRVYRELLEMASDNLHKGVEVWNRPAWKKFENVAYIFEKRPVERDLSLWKQKCTYAFPIEKINRAKKMMGQNIWLWPRYTKCCCCSTSTNVVVAQLQHRQPRIYMRCLAQPVQFNSFASHWQNLDLQRNQCRQERQRPDNQSNLMTPSSHKEECALPLRSNFVSVEKKFRPLLGREARAKTSSTAGPNGLLILSFFISRVAAPRGPTIDTVPATQLCQLLTIAFTKTHV